MHAISHFQNARLDHYLSPKDLSLQLIICFSCLSKPSFFVQLEKALVVSKSTLGTDMRKLRLFFLKYEIKVRSHQKKGIYLEGDEKQIRAIIREVILIHVPSLEFSEIDRQKIVSPFSDK